MGLVQVRQAASTEKFPKPGRYRHFKGSEYEVLSLARHSETDEMLVVYMSVENPDRIWVRPAAMFNEQVDLGGIWLPRFELTDPLPSQFSVRHRLGRWFARVKRRLGSGRNPHHAL